MKALIFVLLTILSFTTYSQGYFSAGIMIELLSGHAPIEEFFEKRDSSFQIEEYELNHKNDSLELIGRCIFSFLDDEIIKAKTFRKIRFSKTTYWKWIKNERGDKFGYIQECNKKGNLKPTNSDFKTINSNIVGLDSIVDEITWHVNNDGDTSCWFINKWIYRKDTLIEYWHNSNLKNNCAWDTQEKYRINKYSYPAQNIIITGLIDVEKNQRKISGTIKELKTYNEFGQLTTIRSSYSWSSYEIVNKYFYKNRKWYKTERWEDNKLKEVVKKTIFN